MNLQRSFLLTIALGMIVPAMQAAENYPVNFPAQSTIDTSVRCLNSVNLTSASGSSQSVAVDQGTDKLLYHDCTSKCFVAVVGEQVVPTFNWTGNWMHGYVYLDRGNDGSFDVERVNVDGKPLAKGDVMAYSNYNGYNSVGVATNNGNVGVNTPEFVVPDLEPGLYRMRYKVDWNSIDPGGNDENGEIHQQTIINNNGAIADVMLYVINSESGLEIVSDHGTVTKGEFTSGSDLPLSITPDEGYIISGVTIECGYDFTLPEGVEPANPSLSHAVLKLPAYLIIDNKITVPAAYTFGKVKITVSYVAKGSDQGTDYGCSLSGSKEANSGIVKVAFGSGTTESEADVTSAARHYFYEDGVLHACKTETITPSFNYEGNATTINFYVDLNQDGAFTAAIGELLGTTPSTGTMEGITLPAELPAGVYRARMEADGVNAVDFLLNLHNATGKVEMDVRNGYVMAGRSAKPVPSTVTFGQTSFRLIPFPTLPGYEASALTVRHGQNVKGEQYIHGNRQWSEFEIPVDQLTSVPSANIDGDLLIYGAFEASDDCEWTQIWNEEFDGNELDMDKWSYHPRYSSAWNRFIAVGDERPLVNKVNDGMYTAYCMATPEEFAATEKQPMISGAIYTSGKFNCTGGWIEARIKTTPHSGNFPAFWMMPVTSVTWPNGGEIDIWEQINTENIAYHTIHSAWGNVTMGTPDQASPKKGGTTTLDPAEWHIYALDWTQDALNFYVDGKKSFTYPNMHYSDSKYTLYSAWPFSKAFYIICNQSVGNGSWAANPDTHFTYHTEFDYVRVYQKKDELSYYSKADGHVSGLGNVVVEEDGDSCDAPAEYFNLQGMRVDPSVATPGIYIVRKGTHTEKTIIR